MSGRVFRPLGRWVGGCGCLEWATAYPFAPRPRSLGRPSAYRDTSPVHPRRGPSLLDRVSCSACPYAGVLHASCGAVAAVASDHQSQGRSWPCVDSGSHGRLLAANRGSGIDLLLDHRPRWLHGRCLSVAVSWCHQRDDHGVPDSFDLDIQGQAVGGGLLPGREPQQCPPLRGRRPRLPAAGLQRTIQAQPDDECLGV